ncbi:MAG: translation initiation factor IF-3 [Eubacteriales bacterium]
MNEAIKASSVRVVEGTEQLGIMPLERAKEIAYDKGLDLVLIAPNSDPPVCRIMDYGKYRYERDKKEKESKRKQQTVEIKEVQLSFKIDTHDFETKARRAIGFLSDGNKVRVVLRFRGREMVHQQIGRDLLLRFEEYCREYGTADKSPVLEGRQLVMFISPNRAQRDKDAKGVKGSKGSKETVGSK